MFNLLCMASCMHNLLDPSAAWTTPMTDALPLRRPNGFRGVMSWTVLRLLVLFMLTVAAYVGAGFGFMFAMKALPDASPPMTAAAIGLGFALLLIVVYRLLIRAIEGRLARELLIVE